MSDNTPVNKFNTINTTHRPTYDIETCESISKTLKSKIRAIDKITLYELSIALGMNQEKTRSITDSLAHYGLIVKTKTDEKSNNPKRAFYTYGFSDLYFQLCNTNDEQVKIECRMEMFKKPKLFTKTTEYFQSTQYLTDRKNVPVTQEILERFYNIYQTFTEDLSKKCATVFLKSYNYIYPPVPYNEWDDPYFLPEDFQKPPVNQVSTGINAHKSTTLSIQPLKIINTNLTNDLMLCVVGPLHTENKNVLSGLCEFLEQQTKIYFQCLNKLPETTEIPSK